MDAALEHVDRRFETGEAKPMAAVPHRTLAISVSAS